jgi:hypothetical protein
VAEHAAPPEPSGPPGGYGVGLPPGVNPDAVHRGDVGGGQNEPMALASLSLGVAGVLLSLCCVGLPLGVVAIALGFVALSRIKHNQSRGRELAIIGIVLGFLGPLLYVGLQLGSVAITFFP